MKKIALLLASMVALSGAFAQDMMADTVVDIAVDNEGFSTLVAAVTEAGLVETLMGEGPFTVFAPTDDAFAAALEALGLTAEELLASEDLASILTYHVVPGKIMAADVIAAVEGAEGGIAEVETVNGAMVSVSLSDGMVMLDATSTVVMTDLEAGNGVVHVIDAVILPPADM
ncbi:MAG: fasciclin domain-containing protein [Deinococcota bacterium]